MTNNQPNQPWLPRHRRKTDRARPDYNTRKNWSRCCDLRLPGAVCLRCGSGPDDQPITPARALASNA